jgi:hypothetical protein
MLSFGGLLAQMLSFGGLLAQMLSFDGLLAQMLSFGGFWSNADYVTRQSTQESSLHFGIVNKRLGESGNCGCSNGGSNLSSCPTSFERTIQP